MSTYKVDNQGRITIPAKWRAEHNVKPGMEVAVLDHDGRLLVQTLDQSIRRAQDIIRRTTRPGLGSAVDELLRERRREVSAEIAKTKPKRRNG